MTVAPFQLRRFRLTILLTNYFKTCRNTQPVIPAQAGIYTAWSATWGIKLEPTTLLTNYFKTCRNTQPVIPAQAGIHTAWSATWGIKLEPTTLLTNYFKTCRNTQPVIPAQAGIYTAWSATWGIKLEPTTLLSTTAALTLTRCFRPQISLVSLRAEMLAVARRYDFQDLRDSKRPSAAVVLEPVYNLFRISVAKARTTICRLVLSFRGSSSRAGGTSPARRKTAPPPISSAAPRRCVVRCVSPLPPRLPTGFAPQQQRASRCSPHPPARSAPG